MVCAVSVNACRGYMITVSTSSIGQAASRCVPGPSDSSGHGQDRVREPGVEYPPRKALGARGGGAPAHAYRDHARCQQQHVPTGYPLESRPVQALGAGNLGWCA